MSKPICDYVKKYAESGTLRLHMPGHKGISISDDPICGVYPYDITEIKGADSLFEADGIIADSERKTSELYGTAETVYSAGGSTLCIQAMLSMTCGIGGRCIAVRNCHRAFVNTASLLDLDVFWVYPEYENGSLLSGRVTAEMAENAILSAENACCFYMTSPDYLGRIYDVGGIAEVCHKHGIPLVVDNAHGAHLAFLGENIHPIKLGADICCDSAHKMLPALTGGAYLHIGNEKYVGKAKQAMSRFGSTSPSYLIMQSLDVCADYLEKHGRRDIPRAADMITELKKELSAVWTIEESEPLRITIRASSSGLTGDDLADILRENGIECEYSDETHVVLLFSPLTSSADLKRLRKALSDVRMPKIRIKMPDIPDIRPQKVMPIREAAFAESEDIPTDEADGRICAEIRSACPPGVALIVSGEKIDENCIKILKRYSIFHVNVVK